MLIAELVARVESREKYAELAARWMRGVRAELFPDFDQALAAGPVLYKRAPEDSSTPLGEPGAVWANLTVQRKPNRLGGTSTLYSAKWGFAEPFRDYAAPVRSYQGMITRQEWWALTRKGRGLVAAVRAAVMDAGRALQLPSRLLDGVEHTINRGIRRGIAKQSDWLSRSSLCSSSHPRYRFEMRNLCGSRGWPRQRLGNPRSSACGRRGVSLHSGARPDR
jgi:hypothetical protein